MRGDAAHRVPRSIGVDLGLRSLHFKFEGLNPTGSFKDRGMVVAVARALEGGSRAIICASTGNTSASAAAYGARFGLRTVVVVPAGKIALGKLVQAQVFGATVLIIEGNFDEALRSVRQLAETHPVTLVNSVNPNRIEGQKTAAFEVVDELGDAPDVLAIPVGNAGNITAYWRGFREYREAGRTTQLPRMIGGQAEGAAPLVLGGPVTDPQTFATAIRIGNPASWASAIAARDEFGGADRLGDRRRDRRRPARPGGGRGRLLRAGVGRVARGAAQGGARTAPWPGDRGPSASSPATGSRTSPR